MSFRYIYIIIEFLCLYLKLEFCSISLKDLTYRVLPLEVQKLNILLHENSNHFKISICIAKGPVAIDLSCLLICTLHIAKIIWLCKVCAHFAA